MEKILQAPFLMVWLNPMA